MEEGQSRAILGLGSNLGVPADLLEEAVRRLSEVARPVRISSLYRTAPVGDPDQPDFLNAVCLVRTRVTPEELLDEALRVERALGRVRAARGAAREIDVDLLAWDDRRVATPRLTIPHPRLHERRFVLEPLAEILPGWRHPLSGRTVQELLAAAPPARVERVGVFPGGAAGEGGS